MKKPFIVLSLIVISLASTVKTKAQINATYGPELGFAASGLVDSYNSDISAGVLLHGGATAHLQIGGMFAVRPSLLLQSGTFVNPDYESQKTKLTRLYIPIPVLFSKQFSNDNKLYAGAGPYIKYALSGKGYFTNPDYSTTYRSIKFGSGSGSDMKRTDFGLHFRGGFDFAGGASLSLFLNYGISHLDPTGVDTKTISIDAIGFSFAWMFGGNSSGY